MARLKSTHENKFIAIITGIIVIINNDIIGIVVYLFKHHEYSMNIEFENYLGILW